jgi:hypothetical protein
MQTQTPKLDLERTAQEVDYVASLAADDIVAAVNGDRLAETADGCQVAPNGRCPHGYRSPLLVLGVI